MPIGSLKALATVFIYALLSVRPGATYGDQLTLINVSILPFSVGTQTALGVGPPSTALLFVICSPVGPYYKGGFKPVKLLASTEYVRAFPGGTGGYKLGANYGPGVVPQVEAAKLGYDQILWLYGEDDRLTEVRGCLKISCTRYV
jgi:branched-chain amino acid aminotransferase